MRSKFVAGTRPIGGWGSISTLHIKSSQENVFGYPSSYCDEEQKGGLNIQRYLLLIAHPDQSLCSSTIWKLQDPFQKERSWDLDTPENHIQHTSSAEVEPMGGESRTERQRHLGTYTVNTPKPTSKCCH